RASQRDGQTIDQIQKIIAAQMPRAQKQKLADDIVLNEEHIEHLHAKLEPLHQRYLARSKQ
ncbi:MAG: dephospho-CoA kinase, partial [Acinetobacter sp.]